MEWNDVFSALRENNWLFVNVYVEKLYFKNDSKLIIFLDKEKLRVYF